MSKTSASSARATRTARNARRTSRRKIDYSDIPSLSTKQLRAMRRVGRPPLGSTTRQLIAIRIDPHVLGALQREAERRGLGYQTLIHQLLAKFVARRRGA